MNVGELVNMLLEMPQDLEVVGKDGEMILGCHTADGFFDGITMTKVAVIV